jgi:hypothetical protein
MRFTAPVLVASLAASGFAALAPRAALAQG